MMKGTYNLKSEKKRPNLFFISVPDLPQGQLSQAQGPRSKGAQNHESMKKERNNKERRKHVPSPGRALDRALYSTQSGSGERVARFAFEFKLDPGPWQR